MSRSVVALGAFAILPLVSCGGSLDAQSPDMTFPAQALMHVASAEGKLRIEVRSSPQPLTRGVGAMELLVTDREGAAQTSLEVVAVPWMASHGHGASVVPSVTPMGGGRYVVTNIDLFMPGRWEIRTTMSGSVSDHVALAFDIP